MEETINKSNFNKNNIDILKKKFISSKPFPHIIVDNFLKKKYANEILENFKIDEKWINYSFVNNFKKFGFKDRTKMNKNLNSIFNLLSSKNFTKKLEYICGIKGLFLDKSLDGGGLHQIFSGGYLNIHTDFTSHTTQKNWRRILNILIYLNKDWDKKYNGNLELWNENGTKMIREIYPKFNRCVIFLTNDISFHGHPKKLNCPKNISRKSIAAYYFIKENKNLDLNPTNYISRPQDNFKTKILINFDKYLNYIYSYLKRKRILDDYFITKIINFFYKK